MQDLLVIGAGAAGLACAIFAAEAGLSVTLLERNDKPGKKILATGNGRCNVSNRAMHAACFHGAPADFIESVLEQFSVADLCRWLERLGLPIVDEGDGRLFPHSLQAATVVRALEEAAIRRGVTVVTESYIKHIEPDEVGFTALTFDNRPFRARFAAVATGGMSLKKSGSDGNGYRLAERLGHTVTPLFPGIVALTAPVPRELDGVKLPAEASLWVDGERMRTDRGDVLFTKTGLSGPPILQLARHANAALAVGKRPEVRLCYLRESWMRKPQQRQTALAEGRSVGMTLGLWFGEKLATAMLAEAGVDPHTSWNELASAAQETLDAVLTGWTFVVTGSKPLEAAQVTCGGVPTEELNGHFGSRHVPGLYFIGEIVDVDGDCGGYNLHWAFASAKTAVNAMRRKSACSK